MKLMELAMLYEAVENMPISEEDRQKYIRALKQVEKSYDRLLYQVNRTTEEKQVINKLLARTSEDLSRALEESQAANQAKSAFLANMSHELRTPLNAIIGYADLLMSGVYGSLTHTQSDRMQRILGNGQHLLRLINDILDLSKIEAGRLDLIPEEISIIEVIEQAMNVARPMAEKNNNSLHSEISPALGKMLVDVTRLKQILFNLLSNACKFTQNGTVILTVERIHIGTEEWVHFDVEDTGIGMSEEQVTQIFGEFVQLDASTTKLYQGSGLGLTIVKRLCDIMGGTITVQSELGEGSLFTVQLPVYPK